MTVFNIKDLKKEDLVKMIDRRDYQITQLKQQLAEKDKEKTQLAIQELEKVNGILTDTIIEVTQDEFDLNKLYYLEEISAKFYEKMQQQIKELKGE